jgi:2-keto-4-pentenoate hydratase/2-oxohepta-3-ene-1,7-dioic acid hydratase in catechol pathway
MKKTFWWWNYSCEKPKQADFRFTDNEIYNFEKKMAQCQRLKYDWAIACVYTDHTQECKNKTENKKTGDSFHLKAPSIAVTGDVIYWSNNLYSPINYDRR